MQKKSTYYFELILVVLFTLITFAALTIPHLQHGVAFIFPVPLAIFIIRNRIKDGIIPAIILMIFAPLITHFLPVGNGSWVRGFLIMMTAVTIGFLHGGLTKLKMSHLKEILIVMGAELFFGSLMTLVFFLNNDNVFSYDIEFPHYFETFARLFNIKTNTIYAQNIRQIFINSVIPYVIALSITEVLLTHILIHLVLKYGYDLDHGRPFTGLYFRLPKWFAIGFLVLLIAALSSLFFLGQELPEGVLTAIIILFIVVLSLLIIFILQGVLYFIFRFRAKHHKELSLGIFITGLFFSVPFAIVGALSVIFGWSEQLIVQCHGKDC